MKKLSVAIATYNEENNIKKCIESVKDLADEIIIVDGSSNDKTVEIAKSLGAQVSITTNPKNFHINKQKAIDLAKSEWILQLDADELVSQQLKNEINKILSTTQTNSGFWIPRKNFFLGRFLLKGGQYPDYTIRLYKRGKGKLPQKDIHEQATIEGSVGYLSSPLYHYSYENFSDYLARLNLYTDYSANQLRDSNIKKSLPTAVKYIFFKPFKEFVVIYILNKGFMDGFQGFVFAFFSSLRYTISYIKFWES